MPCCDPPAPWEGRSRASAEVATRLLCESIGDLLRAQKVVSSDLLLWFITHREIDLEQATTPYFGRVSLILAEAARSDIDKARNILRVRGVLL